MGLAGARFPQDHFADGIIGRFRRARQKIIHDTIDERSVQLIDLERGFRPDALEVMGPIKIDWSERLKSLFHFVIQKTYMDSPFKLSPASRIA